MKRIALLLVLAFAVSAGFAQKKDRTSAFNSLRSGKLNKALEYIEKTITDESTMNDAKTWYYRGQIYLQIALTDKPEYKALAENPLQTAYESYKKALSLPDVKEFMADIMTNMNVVAENFYNKGVASYNDKEYSASMSNFLKAADVKNEIGVIDTTAMLNAVQAADLAKLPNEALKINQRMLDANIQKPGIYSAMVSEYLTTGDTATATATAAKGRSLFPADLVLLFAETNIYLFTGKNEKALENLNVALERDPTNITVLFNLGIQYDKLGRMSEAEKVYKKALEVKPDYFDAIYNLGALFVNNAAKLMGEANAIPVDKVKEYDAKKAEADAELEKALPYLEQAHQMDPADRNTIATLKEIYARKNMLDKVKEMDALLK